MAFERNLYLDQWGRLKPRHSRFVEDSAELSNWGHTCDCCGIGCTPELLANADPGTGLWRFEINPSLKDKMDIRKKRLRWLDKRFPKLLSHLGTKGGNDDETCWFYASREEDRYRWPWVRVVERYGGFR